MKLHVYFLCVSILVLSGCGGGGGGGGSSASSETTTVDGGTTSLALIQFNSEHFAGSGDCAACHSQLTDAGGNDVSMDSDWRSTMMANAARDPLWQAKMASETIRHPALKGVIEEKCSHCHTPMAERQSVFDTGSIDNTKLLDDGFFDPANDYHAMGMDGVSCSLCHQIEDSADLGTKDSFTGHFTIDEITAKPNRLIYGPYPDVFTNLM
jgi:cytochrome c554/c'-like protein